MSPTAANAEPEIDHLDALVPLHDEFTPVAMTLRMMLSFQLDELRRGQLQHLSLVLDGAVIPADSLLSIDVALLDTELDQLPPGRLVLRMR